MKIAFVSTILGYPWGGADALWTRVAESATQRGDRLLIAVTAAVAAHPRMVALAANGSNVHIRPQPVFRPTFASRLLNRLGIARTADTALTAALTGFDPELVIISCGGTYDLIVEPGLHRER